MSFLAQRNIRANRAIVTRDLEVINASTQKPLFDANEISNSVVVSGSFTGTNGYFNNLSAGNLIYTMSGTMLLLNKSQVHPVYQFHDRCQSFGTKYYWINLYENLITSTSITGGTENINNIVVSSSMFIPTTSSGITGTTGAGSMYFSSNDNKLHIYNGTGWRSSQFL